MKFQNCILIDFEQMHGWIEGRTEGCLEEQKAICPFNFSEYGGIKM